MEQATTAIKKVFLGTWFQRTSLHLREIYKFLKNERVIEGLDAKKAKDYQKKLEVRNVRFHEETAIDFIEAKLGEITITITEDGIILISSPTEEIDRTIINLEKFYTEKLSPVLAYLFSKGAPLPKKLANIKNIYPRLLIGENISQDETNSIFKKFNEIPISVVSSQDVAITSGNEVIIFSFSKDSEIFLNTGAEEVLRSIVFYREFEQQLNSYLNLHRTIWELVAQIREATGLRYLDFPGIRQKILGFLKTLAFVEARLAQMEDIVLLREKLTDNRIKKILNDLGIARFVQLTASRNYISHLWQMTIEYTNGSLNLLDSLYQENTQRELNALKFITLIGALTGFFRIIAFWPVTFTSSIATTIAIVAISFSFYYLLRYLIYNRRFSIKKG